MTDNEIIKALEHCGNIVDSTCKECVYHETYNASCVVRLIRDALDLINRQKAHIERLEKVEYFATKTIEKQTAEIERLKHILVSFMSEVENWEHKYGVDTSNIPKIAVLGTEKENCIKQVKSEAYREFWMKLRTHGHKMMGSDWSGEFCAKAILVEDGDNLLKELTESKNDLEG